MTKEQLKPMDIWLVRIGDNTTLTKMQIWNKYKKTVELRHVDGIGRTYHTWNDVQFVEKI